MGKVIFVNQHKLDRSKEIINLINGDMVAVDSGQGDRAQRFHKMLNEAKIDLKEKDKAIQFVYEKLGGLMRTEEQQKKADVIKKEAQKKGKKKQIEE